MPQSHHLHVLLAGGLEIIERLFPGIEEEWIAGGAVPIVWPRDALWLTPQGWSDRFPDGVKILSASREFLEWVVRRRLVETGNVRFLERTEVIGLVGGDGFSVAGVQPHLRRTAGAT